MGPQHLSLYPTTALRLGLGNVARVLSYRALKRGGAYRWLLPGKTPAPLGLQVRRAALPTAAAIFDRAVLAEADELLAGKARFFRAHAVVVGSPPDWFLNPFCGVRHGQTRKHWSDIPDIDAASGDIKIVWEMSRFSWAPVLARAWRVSGDPHYLETLTTWIEDWWRNNPPNVGPNWKCGQETSIRLINTLLASFMAEEALGVAALRTFVESHCRRIVPTLSYAIGQDNNHGTSEAAGLFIGGAWLARQGSPSIRRSGERWAGQGRRLLGRLVGRLVQNDGSFSQHSLTYHRVMLDTLSMAELFRRVFKEPPLAPEVYATTAAAVKWFGAMIDPVSGDGPNLGANDGAQPYRLDQSAYRDFRPSLQLASVLFLDRPALGKGPWDESLAWFGLELRGKPWLSAESVLLADGGYVVLRQPGEDGTWALLRVPTARFRPSQADALHLDLWHRGRNVLRDGGTYSYATEGGSAESLAGVAGHNTVQFDGRDQMPRLGRFLYGHWLHVHGDPAITRDSVSQAWSGFYVDAWGARHERQVSLAPGVLRVIDRVSGFAERGVLRWRLAPADWRLKDSVCESEFGSIALSSDVPIRRVTLLQGWESKHYLEKTPIPVLELEVGESPAMINTAISLS